MKISRGQTTIAMIATAVAVSGVFLGLFGYNVNRTSGVSEEVDVVTKTSIENKGKIESIKNVNEVQITNVYKSLNRIEKEQGKIKEDISEVLFLIQTW